MQSAKMDSTFANSMRVASKKIIEWVQYLVDTENRTVTH